MQLRVVPQGERLDDEGLAAASVLDALSKPKENVGACIINAPSKRVARLYKEPEWFDKTKTVMRRSKQTANLTPYGTLVELHNGKHTLNQQ